MIKGGYMGAILRVDLSKNTIKEEALPGEDVLRKCIGGANLGQKYLFDETPPSVQPLDPESRFICMTGPLTGTVWPCSSRHALINLDSDCPQYVGASFGGGFWAAKLKWAGYDGIIVQGKASEPVYLLIQNGKPTLRDAKHLWGKETRETEALIREELQDPACSALCTGPAGEHCLPGSIVLNDQNHSAGKGGAGQLMGSKNLKAIAISGQKKSVPLADTKKLTELALEYRKDWQTNWPHAKKLAGGGAVSRYDKYAPGSIAFKNYTDEIGGAEWIKEVSETVRASQVLPRPCFNCPAGCSQDIIVGKGPYKGYRSSGDGGGAWGGIGGQTGIMEGGTVIYVTDLATRLGIETGIMGQKLGLLFECYEKGLIDRNFTDGLELTWGNSDAVIKLLYKFVNQEGIGKLLAKTQDEIARVIGKGADQFLGGYHGLGWHWDHRRTWGHMLAHAVSTYGIAMEGSGVETSRSLEDLGLSKPPTSRWDVETTPIIVQRTAIRKRVYDSVGLCLWVTEATDINYTIKALNYATGWDLDVEEALLVGERGMNEARIFSLRRGVTTQDVNIGPRFLDGHNVGEFAGHPLRPHIKDMIKGFNNLMGWDPETGIPLEQTLVKVGLENLVQDLRKFSPQSVETPAVAKKKAKPRETKKIARK